MSTLESVVKEVKDLSPEDRERLRDILNAEQTPADDGPARLRNKFVHTSVPPTPEELARIRAMIERTSVLVGAAWKSDMSALEAVQEQRRDL